MLAEAPLFAAGRREGRRLGLAERFCGEPHHGGYFAVCRYAQNAASVGSEAFVGDTAVVDSRSPLLFWEERRPVPHYAFDPSDVRMDLLHHARAARATYSPVLRAVGSGRRSGSTSRSASRSCPPPRGPGTPPSSPTWSS